MTIKNKHFKLAAVETIFSTTLVIQLFPIPHIFLALQLIGPLCSSNLLANSNAPTWRAVLLPFLPSPLLLYYRHATPLLRLYTMSKPSVQVWGSNAVRIVLASSIHHTVA